jgi:hypothetical protein
VPYSIAGKLAIHAASAQCFGGQVEHQQASARPIQLAGVAPAAGVATEKQRQTVFDGDGGVPF